MTDCTAPPIAGPVVALVGPTAIGKTALSLELCARFNCEIVSVDSMQVYRFMDIGTAKATREERSRIPHHLIDIVDPDDAYNAARFVEDCLEAVRCIHGRGAIPLLTGGTGLYLAALKNGLFEAVPVDRGVRERLQMTVDEKGVGSLHEQLRACDPDSAARIHPNHSSRIIRALEIYLSTGITMTEHVRHQACQSRPPVFERFTTIGLTCERELLYKRINERTVMILERGLETEVRMLLARGYSPRLQSMQSIGYRHMLNYIRGDWIYEQCAEFLARDTRHYAKRQFTWFNRDTSITWFDMKEPERVVDCVAQFLKYQK